MTGRAVLGVDAAWTDRNPSGVALAVEKAGNWRLVAADPSYAAFAARAGIETGNGAEADMLLRAARGLGGVPVALVAVDMPLARHPVIGRRPSDLAISRLYGARHAATHSPSALRPGPVADRMREGFAAAGYPLRTAATPGPGIIEVYPHPALIELCGAERRLPYKVGRRRQYWPDLPEPQRRALILAQWARIGVALEPVIAGAAQAVADFAPAGARGRDWKAQEDRIDAIVCAAVAVRVLQGRAVAHGDGDSAIWVPSG